MSQRHNGSCQSKKIQNYGGNFQQSFSIQFYDRNLNKNYLKQIVDFVLFFFGWLDLLFQFSNIQRDSPVLLSPEGRDRDIRVLDYLFDDIWCAELCEGRLLAVQFNYRDWTDDKQSLTPRVPIFEVWQMSPLLLNLVWGSGQYQPTITSK